MSVKWNESSYRDFPRLHMHTGANEHFVSKPDFSPIQDGDTMIGQTVPAKLDNVSNILRKKPNGADQTGRPRKYKEVISLV